MTDHAALIADIGGTHVRFALVQTNGDIIHTQILAGQDFANVAEACRAYLSSLPHNYKIKHAAWAVAGPLIDGIQTITNRGWSFAVADIQNTFGWDDFIIINDFAAQALSLPHLSVADKILLKPGVPDDTAPVVVVGPGTGLGVGGVMPLKNSWHMLPGEGGHVSLSASNPTEASIIAQLQTRFDPVMTERVLSGQGLVNLYEAMAVLQNSNPLYKTPQDIAQAALQGEDRLAVETLTQFCAFLGTATRDAALMLGARGGVYLAGGILPHMAEFLAASPFKARFIGTGAVASYLDAIPVWLVTHPLPAFIGLQYLLQTRGIVKPG